MTEVPVHLKIESRPQDAAPTPFAKPTSIRHGDNLTPDDADQENAAAQIHAWTHGAGEAKARSGKADGRPSDGSRWRRYMRGLVLRANARLLLRSGLFDEDWYKSQYPEAVADGISPITHFLEDGCGRGYQPNPLFDSRWYWDRYPDVQKSGQNPVIHYLKYGFREGRDPGPKFETEFYLATNPDVREAGVNPLGHYLMHGGSEGRHPTRKSQEQGGKQSQESTDARLLLRSGLFDEDWYKSQYPEAVADGISPITHFLEDGCGRGYQPNPLFDSRWYWDRYPDVQKSGQNPVIHYLKYGFREGRDPGPKFETEFYLATNPDVREAGVNPLGHYLMHGGSEGRHPTRKSQRRDGGINLPQHRKISSAIRRLLESAHFDKSRDIVLLITHDASRTGAPILAWNIVKRLRERHNVVTLVLGDGELVGAFKQCSAAVIGPVDDIEPDAAEVVVESILASCSITYAIANTTQSHRYVEPLAHAFVPVISMVHEFASYFSQDARSALDWSTKIIFSTRVTLDAAKSQLPNLVSSQRIHLLPQGRCDLPMSAGAAAEAERVRANVRPSEWQNALIVLGAGTVEFRKGVDLFLSCAAAVAAMDLRRPVRFVWIGRGYDPINDRSYCSYLAEQITRSGLTGKVAIIDAVEDLDPAYAAADVFFLSSRLDPLPNVTIDAAFHGLPVVCFEQATGMADLLAANLSLQSCVVPYLDVQAAAGIIARLANDETMRKQYGAAACRFAETTFDLGRYVAEIDKIGRDAVSLMRQQQEDFNTIRDDDLFDHHMYAPDLPTRDHAIRRFLADWLVASDDVVLRRPVPGFHPRIYARERSDISNAAMVNPLAHFIRHSAPSGPWKHQVISPSAGRHRSGSGDKPRVGLHAHFYYPQLSHDFFEKLKINRAMVDLLLTTDTEAKAADLRRAGAKYGRGRVDIRVVPNRGRDVGPMMTALAEEILRDYDIIGHVHGKRTELKDRRIGDEWREFLWQNLIGDLHPMMDIIIDHFVAKPDLGLVFPSDPAMCGWDANLELAAKIAARCGIARSLPTQIDFPVGMMFWARVDALRPLIALQLQWEDYPEEPVAYDGTVLHALERLLPLVARQADYQLAVTHVPTVTR